MGFFDKLFGRAGDMSDARVDRIIDAYAATIEKPRAIGDERDLPYPKAEIKEAIRRSMEVQDAQMKDVLRAAYICLADFLPLTHEERRTVSEHGPLVAGVNDPETFTQQDLNRLGDHLEKWTALTARVSADSDVLRAELGT